MYSSVLVDVSLSIASPSVECEWMSVALNSSHGAEMEGLCSHFLLGETCVYRVASMLTFTHCLPPAGVVLPDQD